MPVALLFGVTLYTTGRAGQQVSVLWALVPARLFGSALVTAPLAARRRLRLTRRALPMVARRSPRPRSRGRSARGD